MILAAAIKYKIEATGKEVILCGARHGDVFVQLEALGFKEVYKHNQYFNRNLDLYVYVRYNKIEAIQIAKIWEPYNFSNYTEYLNKVNYVLNQLESTLYSKEE